MKIEALGLEHKGALEAKFRALGVSLSEYCFANKYLFRKKYDVHVITEDSMLWVTGKTLDEKKYLMPTENLQEMATDYLLEKLKGADIFFPLPEDWIPSFDPAYFQATYNRNDSDYLFKREKIADYPGRKLSPKRNLLKQFHDIYQAEVFSYGKEHREDALALLNLWQKDFENEKTDFHECQEGLLLAEELNLSGIMVYIKDEPAAFVLGGSHLAGLYDILFAKALRRYKGIYPFLFEKLAHHLPSQEITCLNWEDDLGHAGLRQSKLSYQPDKIAHKYRVFKKPHTSH